MIPPNITQPGKPCSGTSRYRGWLGRGAYTADVEAAFFDLDKTVIARASMMAFARDFYREGLISRRSLAKGLWTQVVYVQLGASAKKLARVRRSVLALTRGWEQAKVSRIVAEGLEGIVGPITYAEAAALIGEHRDAGRRVVIVSAAPAEIVEPLGHHLGVNDIIASTPEVDAAGRYTGRMERYAYGPVKAELMRQAAERDGLDLAASWAYSDSVTDLPMLEAVGHPVAVNPDRALRRIAAMRGWPVLRFERTGTAGQQAVAPDGRARSRWAWWGPGVAAAAATGGITALAWRRRGQLSLRH